jgi:hypothetical protein
MMLHHDFFSHRDEVGETVLFLTGDQRRTLRDRNGKTKRNIHVWPHVATVTRDPANANEARSLSRERFSYEADATIRHHCHIKRASGECLVDSLAKMRIAVDVFNFRRNLRDLVRPTMKHGDFVASL